MNNQELVDASIGHQINVQFYANGVVRKEVGQLNDDDEVLLAALLLALASLPPGSQPQQIDAALAQVQAANAQTYAQIEQDLNAELLDATQAEVEFQESLLADSNPSSPGAGVVFAAMIATPIMGATLRDTMASLAADRFDTVRRAVQAGYVSGKTPDEIMLELRGTKAAKFSDGKLHLSRAHLETVVRSSISHAVEYASAAFYALNEDIVKAVVWLSVLDSKTSPPCIARSGKRYTVKDHKPIGHRLDWGAGPGRYHYNCRSTSAPLVAGEVPNANRFQDWLKRQPAGTQDEVLGRPRGQMFRAGQPVESFFNNKGRVLTLEQLKERGARP